MMGESPLTLSMVNYLGIWSRSGHYCSLLSSRIINLELLNAIGYHKVVLKGGGCHPGKDLYKTSAINGWTMEIKKEASKL